MRRFAKSQYYIVSMVVRTNDTSRADAALRRPSQIRGSGRLLRAMHRAARADFNVTANAGDSRVVLSKFPKALGFDYANS